MIKIKKKLFDLLHKTEFYKWSQLSRLHIQLINDVSFKLNTKDENRNEREDEDV